MQWREVVPSSQRVSLGFIRRSFQSRRHALVQHKRRQEQHGPHRVEDTAELKSLQATFVKAEAQTILPHPGKQVEDCQGYCTWAARRLEKARAAAVADEEAVVRFEAELLEGLPRLEEIKAAAVPPTVEPVMVDLSPTVPAHQAVE